MWESASRPRGRACRRPVAMLRTLLRPAAASGVLAFGTGRHHRCEQQNSPESDSQQEFLRVWFDGMKPGYDARWFDRDSEWFRSFIASRTVWEDLWEATSAAPPPVDSDAFTTLEAVLVLDQVPRSLFPASPRAFASDDRALKVAREALEHGNTETHQELMAYRENERAEWRAMTGAGQRNRAEIWKGEMTREL